MLPYLFAIKLWNLFEIKSYIGIKNKDRCSEIPADADILIYNTKINLYKITTTLKF